jgi:hypothetical protein
VRRKKRRKPIKSVTWLLVAIVSFCNDWFITIFELFVKLRLRKIVFIILIIKIISGESMKKNWVLMISIFCLSCPLHSQSNQANDSIPVIKGLSNINEENLRTSNLIKKINRDVSEKVMDSLSIVSVELYDSSNYYLDNFTTILDNEVTLHSIEISLANLNH